MKKVFLAVFLCATCPVYGEILKVSIDGVINPITSEFLQQAVRQAENQKAEFLLIQLTTPGGLGVSMQEIIQSILNSQVPVVCYVGPKGARAASAGFFILLSADVAAMAPGTNTGAAHPVFPFGMENKVMLEKVRNDALANLRSIVKERKRNYELAEKGVLESSSYTEQEALDGGLIDLIAEDENQLLKKLEGLEITRFGGGLEKITTQDQQVLPVDMTLRQEVLSTIANPNFALILGVIGLLGLYLEFTLPGLIFPGVLGGISLLLSLLGFSLLPVNLIGGLLILLALGLFIAEVTVQGFGLLGMGGTVAMMLGILFLIDAPFPEVRIGWGYALAVTVPFALIFTFLLRLVVRSHLGQITTGEEGLVGMAGRALTDINREEGKVFVNGEWWQAISDHPVSKGSRVRVRQARRLTLLVEQDSESVRD